MLHLGAPVAVVVAPDVSLRFALPIWAGGARHAWHVATHAVSAHPLPPCIIAAQNAKCITKCQRLRLSVQLADTRTPRVRLGSSTSSVRGTVLRCPYPVPQARAQAPTAQQRPTTPTGPAPYGTRRTTRRSNRGASWLHEPPAVTVCACRAIGPMALHAASAMALLRCSTLLGYGPRGLQ